MKFWWLLVKRAGCLLLAVAFGVHSAHVSSAENSKGVTSYHQLVSGDADSYEAFDVAFYSWERPILIVSKHDSLCYLNQPEFLAAFETRLRDQTNTQGHRHIATHMPCTQIQKAVKKDIEPEDYSQLYLFQGLTPKPQASIDFVVMAANFIETQNDLTLSNVSDLANLLGIQGEVTAIYDWGVSDIDLGFQVPHVSFGLMTGDDPGQVQHRIVSARWMSDGLWIYERIKRAPESFKWDALIPRIHSLSLSLLDDGARTNAYASAILKRQPEEEEAYFFENVAFALKSEFEANDFGVPILTQYWFEEEQLGHTVDIVDGSSVYKEGDWLYFTKARFLSTKLKSESGDNLATNMPVIVKERIKASCNRKVFSRSSASLSVAGQKSKWSDAPTPFGELDMYTEAFVTAFCQPVVSTEDADLEKLNKFASLYSWDVFGMPDYSSRAFRMYFEYLNYTAN